MNGIMPKHVFCENNEHLEGRATYYAGNIPFYSIFPSLFKLVCHYIIQISTLSDQKVLILFIEMNC